MADNEQYKVRIGTEIVRRLDELATRFGRRSGNQVAAEVIETYLEFWEAAEAVKTEIVDQQRAGLFESTGVYTRGKGSRGEIEMVKKDARSHKPKK